MKVGLPGVVEKMQMSGVSELEILDFSTLTYIELLRESRAHLIKALVESTELSEPEMALYKTAILRDSRFFYDS